MPDTPAEVVRADEPIPVPEGEAPEKVFTAFQFGAVLRRAVHTVRFPGLPDEYYFKAQAPDVDGRRSIDSALMLMAQEDLRFTPDGKPVTDGIHLRGGARYLAKCRMQITAFRLPETAPDGEMVPGAVCWQRGDQVTDAAGKAILSDPDDPTSSPLIPDDVYLSFGEQTSNYVEGALDYIAGRTSDLRQQFEAFLADCAECALIT
jgi:hypothetical protein